MAREDALRDAEARAEQAEAALAEQRAEHEAEREKAGDVEGILGEAEARAEQAEAAWRSNRRV